MPDPSAVPVAAFGGTWVATGLEELSTDPAVLDTAGRWAVSISFEGEATLARFGHWLPGRAELEPALVGGWHPPKPDQWRSSLDEEAYGEAAQSIRERIARGDVYQANLCRTVRTQVDPRNDIAALYTPPGPAQPGPARRPAPAPRRGCAHRLRLA